MGILIDLTREILEAMSSQKKPHTHRALNAKNRSRKNRKHFKLSKFHTKTKKV